MDPGEGAYREKPPGGDAIRPRARLGLVRRDWEPHRSLFLRWLAAASALCGLSACCPVVSALVGLPLGLTAWVLAGRDLRQMRGGLMDPRGGEGTALAREVSLTGIVASLCSLVFWAWLILREGW
jgi:hypothetical protein